MAKLTLQQIQDKAAELTKKMGVEVTPMVFEPTEDDAAQAVGYLKKPGYNERAHAFDALVKGDMMGGAEAVFFKCLIKEESDPRLINDDDYKFSAVSQCIKFVKGFDNLLKKK